MPRPESRDLAVACARIARESKARDIVVIDVSRHLGIADYFVIATGRSSKHVKGVADEIDRAARALRVTRIGSAGLEEGRWALCDYGDVVVHVFDEEARAYYEIDALWSDAPRVNVDAS